MCGCAHKVSAHAGQRHLGKRFMQHKASTATKARVCSCSNDAVQAMPGPSTTWRTALVAAGSTTACTLPSPSSSTLSEELSQNAKSGTPFDWSPRSSSKKKVALPTMPVYMRAIGLPKQLTNLKEQRTVLSTSPICKAHVMKEPGPQPKTHNRDVARAPGRGKVGLA